MKVGFVGGGTMAEAFVGALLRKGLCQPSDIFVSELVAARRDMLIDTYGVNVTADGGDVCRAARVLVLAVKPQMMVKALTPLASEVSDEHLCLSIAAGCTLNSLEGWLPHGRLVRTMPNLPCLVGEGMTAFCLGRGTGGEDHIVVSRLLNALGEVIEAPEHLFDAVTAVSGSGPAFYATLMLNMTDAAVAQGIPRAQALVLARQTMLGTATLLKERRQDPADLVKAVTSAKGTTAAGLEVLHPSDVAEVLEATIKAAADRSRELAHMA